MKKSLPMTSPCFLKIKGGLAMGTTAPINCQAWKEYYNAVAPSTIDEGIAIRPSRAEGVYLWENDKQYIDFDASVATVPMGHAHPFVTAMLVAQLRTVDSVEGSARPPKFFIDICGHEFEISAEALAKKLCHLTFGEAEARVIYEVTGATAVNAAVKFLLVQRPERRRFVAFEGAFHGRHGYALDLTCSKPEQKRYYPASGIQVLHLPFPKSAEHIAIIKNTLARWPLEEFNAVFIEAIQGEGGIELWHKKHWRALAPIFQENKIVVVADEIQCGLGRTGNFWGFNNVGIEPDIVVTGKGLANGHPISAVIYKREVEKRKLHNGWHAGTFPAHPTALAAGIATLSLIEKNGIQNHIRDIGDYLSHKIDFALPKKHEGEDRYCLLKGAGLMRGIEFRYYDDDVDVRMRDTVLRLLKERGILTIGCGHPNINPTLRLLPPYIIQKEHVDKLADCLHEVFAKLK